MIEVEEFETAATEFEEKEIPTFNHGNLCADIIERILENRKFKPLPELTLDIENELTPDISVHLRDSVKRNYRQDFIRYPKMPISAIEVVSPSQNIQILSDKAKTYIKHGIKTVWTIEPFTNSIMVTTAKRKKRFQNQKVESEGIKVDTQKIFGEE